MIDSSGLSLRGLARRIDDDAPARQALADVVVGVAFELERHALGEERAEALARRALELDVDRLVAQPGVAIALGDLARQHRAGRAVRVSDRQVEAHVLAALERVLRLGDQAAVEHALEPMILVDAAVDRVARPGLGLVEQLREIEALRLGVLDKPRLVEHLPLADHFVEPAVAERRHHLAHLFGDEEEVVDDVLRLADEALAQHRVLRRDADRAGVQVALAHHDAAGGDQRRRGEAELVGAQERADHDVAAGSQAAVDLHRDAGAQAVHHQRLMRLGEADLPRGAGVLDRGQRRCAGAALEAGDRDVIRLALGDARRDRADADLGDELDRNLRPRGLTFFRS